MKTSLVALFADLDAREVLPISINCYFTDSYWETNSTYFGTIHTGSAKTATAKYVSCIFVNNGGTIVTVGYNNGSWTFRKIQ